MRYPDRRTLPVLFATFFTLTTATFAADVLQVPASRLTDEASPPNVDGRVNDEAWVYRGTQTLGGTQ